MPASRLLLFLPAGDEAAELAVGGEAGGKGDEGGEPCEAEVHGEDAGGGGQGDGSREGPHATGEGHAVTPAVDCPCDSGIEQIPDDVAHAESEKSPPVVEQYVDEDRQRGAGQLGQEVDAPVATGEYHEGDAPRHGAGHGADHRPCDVGEHDVEVGGVEQPNDEPAARDERGNHRQEHPQGHRHLVGDKQAATARVGVDLGEPGKIFHRDGGEHQPDVAGGYRPPGLKVADRGGVGAMVEVGDKDILGQHRGKE